MRHTMLEKPIIEEEIMTLLFLFLFTIASGFASECPSLIAEGSLSTIDDSPEGGYRDQYSIFRQVSKSAYKVGQQDFQRIPIIGREFDYEYCKDAIVKLKFKGEIDGEDQFFTAFYTAEDACDGGNAGGSILNEKGALIARIDDGDFSCL